MKKKRLLMMFTATLLLWAGALSAFSNNRKEIHFNVEKIDPTVGMPPVPKMPPRAPAVYVEGNVLYFEDDHPAYVLYITDNVNKLVCTVDIPENATEVTLPTTLDVAYGVDFIQGSWRIFGRIAPDGYRPMVVDGKIWKGYETDDTGKRYQCDYYIDGDTLLQGKKYLKCYYNSERLGATSRYMGALYEENGKVYGIQPRNYDAGLMFDFNMQVGDSVFCLLMGSFDSKTFSFICDPPGVSAIDENNIEYASFMKLAKIETIQNGEGLQLRRYHLDLYRQEFDHGKRTRKLPDTIYWIEGIGVENNYPLSPWSFIMESSCKYELEECFIQDKLLYSRSGTTGIEPVQDTTAKPVSDAIYDLQGRRLNGEPRKGIYVREGKKYLKK